jgi:hypothetical protein
VWGEGRTFSTLPVLHALAQPLVLIQLDRLLKSSFTTTAYPE